MTDFEDIVNYPYQGVRYHKRMSVENRAAQFSSFAALTGYEESVKETARLTDERIELNNEDKLELSKRLELISKYGLNTALIKFTYFVKDKRKAGGYYEQCQGIVRKIDNYQRIIILKSKLSIKIDDLIEIKGDFFNNFLGENS